MSSLYVHIPFCSHICSYCDFAKVFYNEKWADDYLDALEFEIKDKNINKHFDTIYIGGGTPSSLSLKQMKRLFDMLKPFSSQVKEYSMEVNPESMNDGKLDLMIDYGINRLSIGVQTFQNKALKMIGRHHTSEDAIALIDKAKNKGIDDINIDLMYGLPGQILEDLKQDIDIISTLDISHISIYSLILEDNTILKNIDYKPLSDEDDALWYDFINAELKKIGYKHYEVSNYYKIKPSLHNSVYWHYEDYEGIGLGAHSLIHHVRYENTRSLTQYLDKHYLIEKTFLSQGDELFEKIMMGLRVLEGINVDKINQMFKVDIMDKYKEKINKYQDLKMLELHDSYLRPTELGLKYLNNILVDFLD